MTEGGFIYDWWIYLLTWILFHILKDKTVKDKTVFPMVVLTANIYNLCHYVNNSTKLNQSPGDVWNENKLYK